jgi:GT2 family glycosyltransferase
MTCEITYKILKTNRITYFKTLFTQINTLFQPLIRINHMNSNIMELSLPTYSVAIRTLGTAGDKYLSTLKSCAAQKHKPDKIVVYLAEGYDRPKETIGIEQIVYVPKGMVAQRAIAYDEIDSEYILLLDDDVELQVDSVERLFAGLSEYNGDCIAADVFANHKMRTHSKFVAILGGTYPHWNSKIAVKIRRDGHFSYNNNPRQKVLLSESLPGPAILIKKEVLNSIRFEEERWLDAYGYAFGEDQLFGNKLHKNGFRVLRHYDAGIVHLNAKTGNVAPSRQAIKNMGEIRYLLMYRSCLNLKNNTATDRLLVSLCFYAQQIPIFLLNSLAAVRYRTWHRPFTYISGTISGRRKISIFRDLRKFDNCKVE